MGSRVLNQLDWVHGKSYWKILVSIFVCIVTIKKNTVKLIFEHLF